MVPSRCTTAPSSITSASVRLRILQMTYLPWISDKAIGCSSDSSPCSCLLAGCEPQQGLEGPSNIGYMMERFLRNGCGHRLCLCPIPSKDNDTGVMVYHQQASIVPGGLVRRSCVTKIASLLSYSSVFRLLDLIQLSLD